MLSGAGELSFVNRLVDYPAESLLWKKNPDREKAESHLMYIRDAITNTTDFSPENIKAAIWAYAEEHGKGDVLWPFRMALTGQEKSPDPFVSAALLGKEESIARITGALTKLV